MEGLFQLALALTGIGAFVGTIGLIGLVVIAFLGADKHRSALETWRNLALYGFAFVGVVSFVGLGICFGAASFW